MKSPSSRDLQQLSAYLDGQLSQPDRSRLEARIHSDLALASALQELRQTRAVLRRIPHRRAPRNFTLTPRMAGIRPPVPRLVPVFSWASAVAMLFFIFTLGASLVGQLSFGAATSAAAPMPSGAGPLAAAAPATAAPATIAPATKPLIAPAPANPKAAAPATMAPALAAPATTIPSNALPAPLATPTAASGAGSSNPPPSDQTLLPAPTEQPSVMSVEQATPPPALARAVQPPQTQKMPARPVNPWLLIWPGLAVVLGALALLALWLNKRNFRRKNPPG
jgi:hypothetical protein